MRFKSLSVLAIFIAFAGLGLADQLKPEYQKWLNEDVRWLITSQERAQFMHLATDQARDQFVVAFWEHRNPTPGSSVNAFKAEHYRRLAFANSHFAEKVSGWETDRGKTYILYGPPDSISALNNARSEIWVYNHTGSTPVSFRFVDVCGCGVYQMKSAAPVQ